MTRLCGDCRRYREAEHFYAKTRHPDGSIRAYQTYCKQCMGKRDKRRRRRLAKQRPPRPRMTREQLAAKRREKYRTDMADPAKRERRRRQNRESAARRRANPETHAEILATQRRWKERAIYANPERRATERVYARMVRRMRMGSVISQASAFEAWEPAGSKTDLVDAAPFVAFVKGAFPGIDAARMAKVLALDFTQVKRIVFDGQPHVTLHVVDHAVTKGLGRPDLLNVLYPVEETTGATLTTGRVLIEEDDIAARRRSKRQARRMERAA